MEGDLLGLGEVVGRVGRRGSAARPAAPARAPPARSWSGRAGRCPRTSGPRCRGRPARRAPTAGTAPASMASDRSRRWKSGSMPPSICASSQTSEWTPASGFQWNFTSVGLAVGVRPAGRCGRRSPPWSGTSGGCRGRTWPTSCGAGLGVQRDEVPERVVGGLRLRDLPVRMRLGGVDDVGELDAVLDEEHRDVVADEVEVALVGVELRREPAGVAHGVGRPARAQHGREADEHRRLDALWRGSAALVTPAGDPVADEDPVRAGAARVDHPLGDPLVVEVGDLLAQVMSCSSVGPRSPALSEWSVSGSRTPPAVVRYAPDCDRESSGAPVGLPVGETASGPD